MTELQVFLTFLVNLPAFKGQKHDIDRLAARLRYAITNPEADSLFGFLESMLNLDDAIVEGLNRKQFIFTDQRLSRYPQSVLPKFLFGLTSRIFDQTSGALLPNYNCDSIEAVLTALRLLRRAKVKGSSSISNVNAVKEFLDPQVAPVPTLCDISTDNMSTFWSYILKDFDGSEVLGFPGDGVTSDMKFPYVPYMSFVDPFTLPDPVRRPMIRAMKSFLPENWDVTSDCEFIKFYPYVPFPERIVKLAVVPKSFKTGRGITITNTSSVILGATLRETIWSLVRKLKLHRLVGVHDQTLSHDVLRTSSQQVFCRDIKGGSTCIRSELQKAYLSSNYSARSLFNFSIPSGVKTENGVVDLVTLTMGDASCTALLTVDMLGFLVLAQCYYEGGPRKLTTRDISDAIALLRHEDLVRCVGDDVIAPTRLQGMFDYIAHNQGVVINTRKSSDSHHVHRESCGYWTIREPNGSYRDIYPFRAPDYTNDLVSDLSTLMRSFERTKGSKFSVEIFIAYATRLTHQLEYLNHESYTTDRIGSPIGHLQHRRAVRLRPGFRVAVADDVSYAFRCRESSVEPRYTRRPALERGRIIKSRDITRERSVTTINRQQIHDTFNSPEISGSVSGRVAFAFALSSLFSSNASNLIDVVN